MTDDTDTEIELHDSDNSYTDAESDDVPLSTALREFECSECGRSPMWVLEPDPDSVRYYSDHPCDCGYKHYIRPTMVTVSRTEVDQ